MPGPPDPPTDPDDDAEFDEYERADDGDIIPAPHRCLCCERKRVLEVAFRLCRACMRMARSSPENRRLWLEAERGCPEEPTEAAPGSAEKLDVFTARLLRNEDLHHPDDTRREMTAGERVAMEARLLKLLAEPVQRPPGLTGIERDGTKLRIRPMRRGKKVNLGEVDQSEEAKAEAIVLAFWLEVLGLPADATWEQIAAARDADAARSLAEFHERREEARRQERVSRPTELYG